jgi:GcrA cell cycle regulator
MAWPNDFNWTQDAIDKLRALWAEGHSAAEIGRRMNVSKNAIVGKAHRLKLRQRPSPIIHLDPDAPPRRRLPRAKRRVPLPPLPSATASVSAAPFPAMALPAFVAPPPAPVQAPVRERQIDFGGQCCWPIGDPGTPGYRVCNAPCARKKPYCDAHQSIATIGRPKKSWIDTSARLSDRLR